MKRKIFVLALGFMSLVSVLSFTTNEQETTDRKFGDGQNGVVQAMNI